MEKEKKFSDKRKQELHKEALERWEVTRKADKDQRELAVEDLLFITSEDGQWDEAATEKRADRPRYTVDRVSGAHNQIVGDQRQTREGIKVIPLKDATEDTAKTFTGLIRSIEQQSNADNAYDNAFDEASSGGYGGWRILTDYESDDSFYQKALIKPIHSAASSLYFDPSAQEHDKRDAIFSYLITNMHINVFKDKYPNATITEFDTDKFRNSWWFDGERIKIAEYWFKVPYKKKIGLLNDGRVIDLEEEQEVLDELQEQDITVESTRTVDSFKVYMGVINGAEFLGDIQEWAGKYIPLVPVFGKQRTIDGQTFTWGMVRKAKDAQRIYNYELSTAVEQVALTPKDPYWHTTTQVKGHELKWKQFPAKNTPFLPYTNDPSVPGPPQRTGGASVPDAMLSLLGNASQDIHATTGLEPASLGNVPELKSGKAIEAQQRMGDRGSFNYQDNLTKAKIYTGEILVDLISKVYDTERVVKILGEDDQIRDAEINQPVIDEETGERVIVNDLSIGTYGVDVDTGPNFATKKAETVSQLVTLAGQSEMIAGMAMDLVVENMDLNKKDEVLKRIRKRYIQEGIAEPTEEEIKELGLDQQQPDPMNEELIRNLQTQTEETQMRIEKMMTEIREKDEKIQQTIYDTQKKSVEAYNTMVEALKSKKETGAPITEDDIDALQGQLVLIRETQGDAIAGGELAGSDPVGQPEPIPEGLPQDQMPMDAIEQPQAPQVIQPSPYIRGGE